MASHTQWQTALGCPRADESIEMHVETIDGQWIADICRHPNEVQHARLIAAAPELLAALEGVVNVNADIIAAYTDVIGTESEPGWIVDLREATDIARAAIRAARGE